MRVSCRLLLERSCPSRRYCSSGFQGLVSLHLLCELSLFVRACVPLCVRVCSAMRACVYVYSDTCFPRRHHRRPQRHLHVFCPQMCVCCVKVPHSVMWLRNWWRLCSLFMLHSLCLYGSTLCLFVYASYDADVFRDVIRDVIRDVSASSAHKYLYAAGGFHSSHVAEGLLASLLSCYGFVSTASWWSAISRKHAASMTCLMRRIAVRDVCET